MSRNTHINENGRFDEISSNRANVCRFDDFGEIQLNLSKRNQLSEMGDFAEFQ